MHRCVTLALLVAGCAAPGESRFVLLESESYGCGAAEGLGCGLAIAPVLAEIDALEGVEESRVSWDGRSFQIELRPGADPERVAAAAASKLEGEACCTTASRGKAAGSGPQRWFNAEQTLALSLHEAGVIAADRAGEIETEVGLAPSDTERLRTVLREELERCFERAHAAGGGVHRLWEEIAAAHPRFEARLAEILPPEQCARVSAALSRELDG